MHSVQAILIISKQCYLLYLRNLIIYTFTLGEGKRAVVHLVMRNLADLLFPSKYCFSGVVWEKGKFTGRKRQGKTPRVWVTFLQVFLDLAQERKERHIRSLCVTMSSVLIRDGAWGNTYSVLCANTETGPGKTTSKSP